MRLKYDPFTPFLNSISPFAVHVRIGILGEQTEEMENLRKQYLANLYRTQREDGSWEGSVTRTIDALFVMKLLELEPSRSFEDGLEFLLEGPISLLPEDPEKWGTYAGLFRKMSPEDRKELLSRKDMFLHKGSAVFAKTGAVLFLTGETVYEGDPRVVQAFRSLDRLFRKFGNRWGPLPSSNNILLAYAAHPLKKSSRTTRTALGYLEKQQMKSGNWKGLTNPAATLFVLSNSVLPSAARQMTRVFRWLVENQNEAGVWESADPEFDSFLILESLARGGYANKRQGLKHFMDIHRKRLSHVESEPEVRAGFM